MRYVIVNDEFTDAVFLIWVADYRLLPLYLVIIVPNIAALIKNWAAS